jgi:hypothetical protein
MEFPNYERDKTVIFHPGCSLETPYTIGQTSSGFATPAREREAFFLSLFRRVTYNHQPKAKRESGTENTI